MYSIEPTPHFTSWLKGMRDRRARAKINVSIERLALGTLGDTKHLGMGLQECRNNYGPGYRIYYSIQGEKLLILLCGGDKDSQQRDIRKARALIDELKGVKNGT